MGERTTGDGTSGPEVRRPVGVVLVESQRLVRRGLSVLVSSQADLRVLGECGSADEALETIRRIRRRSRVVVVVALRLPGEHDGSWLMRTLREEVPALRLLGCGANGDAGGVSRALMMGADGYVDTNSEPERFLDALRGTVAGETVLEGLPPEALGAIAEAIDGGDEAPADVTDREAEVLSLAATGLTARQIGNRLGVRERTVTTHLDRIYRKFGVSGRVAAIAEGARRGLVAVGA